MKKLLSLSAMVCLLLTFSCKKNELVVPEEPVKSIDGSWRIIKALRNGTDLTSRFNFSAFRINFTDSAYTITNGVPFIVAKNGTWRFDDPQYPFKMSFTQQNDTARTTSVLYPVTNGVRNITLTFSPGCVLNSYQYTLEKAD